MRQIALASLIALAASLGSQASADTPARIPTGYQVRGSTWYVYDAWHGIRHVKDTRSTADAKLYWQMNGAGGQGPGTDSGANSSGK